VRDLLTAESQETYIKWQRRIQSLTYNFQQELSRISTDFKGYFASQNGQHPQLFKEFRQGNISIETLVILNDMLKFFPIWERKITDDIIWPTVRDKCLRYGEFIKYDKPKMKRIVKDILDVQ
jgi:hypothetical protein